MADLFLPPMAPNTPEPPSATTDIVSASGSHGNMHFFAAHREMTLQTPAPFRQDFDQDSEDPTLTWVRSLPSPFSPFDDFGEISSFPNEYGVAVREQNRRDGNGLSDITEEDTCVEHIIQQDTTVSRAAEPPPACFLNHAESVENVAAVGDSTYSGTTDKKCSGMTQMRSTAESVSASTSQTGRECAIPSVVIDLTGNDKQKENDMKEQVKRDDLPISRKRLMEACSPIASIGSTKRQFLQKADNDVIEVRDAFSPPYERSSSVASYCSISSEILLSPSNPLPNHRLMRDIIRRYLKRQDEMKIIILHAKVVQKSYGSEKRFFCPPPCVRLVGNGWKTKRRRKNTSASSTSSPMPSPVTLNSPGPASGTLTRASDLCAYIGVGGAEKEMQQLHLDLTKDYAAAKNLHTPESDKRKHFQLHIKMFYGDGSEIGRFLSKRIKVISKPSKKKQSVKNPELCIASGTKVSFFNRLRSQTVSTRYLFATRKGFCASSTQWGAFSIYLAREDEDDSHNFDSLDGYIHYGNPVKLVCSVTGMALPRIVIRKVDKQDAIIDTDEPISQLHRCALFLHNTKRQYLCLSQDKVIAHTATPNSRNGNMDRLNDGSCWTIISTEKAEYCWSDSSLHLSNNIGVTPVPVVHSLQINGGGQLAMVELGGENFTPHLSVWFGIVEANTMYRCEECLVCVVPEISKIKPDWRFVKEQIKVPLVLTREDGLLYPTHIDFYYMPEPGCKGVPHPTIREILRSKKFVNNL